MGHKVFKNEGVLRLSMETTGNGFDYGLKGLHSDEYDLSLSSNAYPFRSLRYKT